MADHEIRFRAMGSEAHIALLGGTPADLDDAVDAVGHLERQWSRFLPDSELSLLNRAQGRGLAVSPETMTLVLRAVRAFRLTDGWCDPFMGRDIVALGYDRDFADLLAAPAGTTTVHLSEDGRAHRVRPTGTVLVDRDLRTVCLPAGFDLDSSGIGKGLAADLVTRRLIDRGVEGALVNLGGDLRCRGRHPEGGWRVGLEGPHPGSGLAARFRVTEGAVATSTTLRRRWRDAAGRTHAHLLDPRTGRSAEPPVGSITVLARAGWLAEALAKALLLGGPAVGIPLLAGHGARAIIVGRDGSVERID